MSLELYDRYGIWWFKGRIDRIAGGKYYRQSTGIAGENTKETALAAKAGFEEDEIRRYYIGEKQSLTFSEAVLLYEATPEMAKDLLAIIPEIGDDAVSKITPQSVRVLAAKIYPNGATDSWRRHVITPIRAVINNAHDLGKCAPIRIKSFSTAERLKQDKVREKASRVEKVPANWEWILAFREHANPYQAAMALFMFETGARIGQATQIVPEDLDLQNARLLMPSAKGRPAEWVTISMELVVELANLPPRRPRKAPKSKRRGIAKVFGYATKDGVYNAWKTACKNAGINPIMPHAAGRHGFGTEMLVNQGLAEATVADGGRWSDRALMQKTYSHAGNPDQIIQAALRTGRVQAQNARAAKKLKNKG